MRFSGDHAVTVGKKETKAILNYLFITFPDSTVIPQYTRLVPGVAPSRMDFDGLHRCMKTLEIPAGTPALL